ncbi:MAG: antitoxin family protein [Acidobacteria bacterium]|nr:antitoxin family protein [Acidobacteriota bacterium]
MTRMIEAVYESGVFRPLEPVELPEHEHVVLTVTAGLAELDADGEIMRLLEDPFDLGAQAPLTRRAIYDEAG